MTDLGDHIETLQRSVAVPGTFATIFPDTTDDDLIGSLMDAYAEAQMDGFFAGPSGPALDLDTAVITPDISLAQVRLVVLYAAYQIISTQLLNLKNKVRYEAKGVIYETEQASTVLTGLLKSFGDRKALLLLRAQRLGAGSVFVMADKYYMAAVSDTVLTGPFLFEPSGF